MSINVDYLVYLRPDELEVEFLVRNLSPHEEGAEQALKATILKEQNKTLKPPKHSHVSDGASECLVIKENAASLSKSFFEHGMHTDPREIIVNLTRVAHYISRAVRAKITFGEICDITSSYNSLNRTAKGDKEILGKLYEKQADNQSQFQSSPIINNPSLTGTIPKTSRTIFSPTKGSPNDTVYTSTTKNNAQSGHIVKNTNTSERIQPQLSLANSRFEKDDEDVVEDHRLFDNSELFGDLEILPPVPGNRREPRRTVASSSVVENRSSRNNFKNFYDRVKKPNWNFSFDGSGKGMDVDEFIFRLETLVDRYQYPVDSLERFVFDFVSGTAEKWLWVFIRSNPDAAWEEIRDSMKSRFKSSDSDRATRRKIEMRQQKVDECFSDFVLDVESLNNSLIRKYSERELLEILRDNMSSELRNVTLLLKIRSVEELRVICTKYERNWALNKRNKPTEHFNRRLSAISSDYYSSQSKTAGVSLENSDAIVNNDESNLLVDLQRLSFNPEMIPKSTDHPEFSVAEISNHSNRDAIVCWNCKDLAHYYVDCPLPPQHVFCYGCGRHNILKPNCLFCQKRMLGNQKPNVAQTGGTRSGVHMNQLKNPAAKPM